jgi:site-specific recombinase XerD
MDFYRIAINDTCYRLQACRTLPIPATVTPIQGYPAKLKIYLTNASRYWQARCFFRGRVRTRSLRTTNKREAIALAKSFYEELVASHYAQHWKPTETHSPHQLFEALMERAIDHERDRQLRGEITKGTFQNHVSRLRQYWLPLLGKKAIQDIRHGDIVQAVSILSRRGVSAISISQYLQSLRWVFRLAYAEELVTHIPAFPRIKKSSTPRGGFSVGEYRLLIQTARRLSKLNDIKPATHRNRAGGIFTRTESVPRELAWLIGFMVNGFMRPSDIIHIKHKHVEIVRGERIYLRLTLPETKRHKTQIVTLRPAVRIYENLYRYMHRMGSAGADDYLFLPDIKNRGVAGSVLSRHFKHTLEVAKLRSGQLGQTRTLYSLRHTAIMFRLLYGKGIDLLTLARNARTSVQMVEHFYASQLTAEMNIDLLQSRR